MMLNCIRHDKPIEEKYRLVGSVVGCEDCPRCERHNKPLGVYAQVKGRKTGCDGCTADRKQRRLERVNVKRKVISGPYRFHGRPTEIKALVQEAAAIQGQSVTDFVTISAVESAKRILREREFIELSQRDRYAFVESLLNPPTPNQRLQEATRRYEQVLGNR